MYPSGIRNVLGPIRWRWRGFWRRSASVFGNRFSLPANPPHHAKRRDKQAVAQKGSENSASETPENQAVHLSKPGARKEILLGMGDFRNSVPRDYWKHFGTLRRTVIWRHVEGSTEILVHSATL
jgi:hypothetical protein